MNADDDHANQQLHQGLIGDQPNNHRITTPPCSARAEPTVFLSITHYR